MTGAPRRKRGRPRAEVAASRREAIVTAAAKEFAAGGFARTSLRQIARTAGVDPALVHHYFTGKEELFLAASAFPINPLEILRKQLPDPAEVDSFGTELLNIVVPIWDRPEIEERISAVVRSINDDPGISRMMEEFIRDRLFATIIAPYGDRLSAEARSAVFIRFHALMIGIITDRYLARTQAVVALSPREVAEAFGPLFDTAIESALTTEP